MSFNKAARTILFALCAVAVLFTFSSVASAQSSDNFKVNYFDNNGASGAPDAYVHVVNPGSGALCADIYVWRSDQELSECCACTLTTNQVFTFTVSSVTANPGDHAGAPTTGSIDIIADSNGPGSCDPTNPAPAATLRAWATHVNADSASGGFDVTETEGIDTPLSSGEQSEAASRCAFLEQNGSGVGTCTNDICPGGVAPEVKSTAKRVSK
jgi:hypothetical protein